MADFLSRPANSPEEEKDAEGGGYRIIDSGNSSMKVVVRVRPESEAELRSSCQCVVKVLDEHVLVFDPAGNITAASGNGGGGGDGSKTFGFSSPGKQNTISLPPGLALGWLYPQAWHWVGAWH